MPAEIATTDPLSAAFAALADPTRRAILARLALGESRVGELVQPFSISGPAISRHLRVLENARLIERKVDAQWRICRLQPEGLRTASDWLAQYRDFWEQSLDRLVQSLEGAQTSAPADAPLPATDPSPTHRMRLPSGRRKASSSSRPTARRRSPR